MPQQPWLALGTAPRCFTSHPGRQPGPTCTSVTHLQEGPPSPWTLSLFNNRVKPSPRLACLPQKWQPQEEERCKEKPGCCHNEVPSISVGRGMVQWSSSLCGYGPHSRGAALCPGALACRWAARSDAQQENLIFSFCLFSPLSCETDVSCPAI